MSLCLDHEALIGKYRNSPFLPALYKIQLTRRIEQTGLAAGRAAYVIICFRSVNDPVFPSPLMIVFKERGLQLVLS